MPAERKDNRGLGTAAHYRFDDKASAHVLHTVVNIQKTKRVI